MKKSGISIYFLIGIILLVTIIFLDILCFRFPILGRWGVILWLLSFAYLGIYAFKCLRDILSGFIRRNTMLTCFLLVIYTILLVINIPSAKNISHETTQEIACVLNQLKSEKDKGFHQICMFGYPSRQNYLQAVPTLLFGRNITALNFGGSLYFILGVLIFSAGILRYYRFSLVGDLVSGLLLASFLHLHFFNHFLFFFEQSIFPFSFGLMLVGLFFHYLATPSKIPLVNAGFVLLYLIFSYTPGVSLVFLSTAVLIYLIFQNKTDKNKRRMLIFVVISTLLALFISFLFRKDIHILSLDSRPPGQLWNDITVSFEHILFLRQNPTMLSPIFTPLFLFVTAASLVFFFGARYAFVSLWIIIVLIFSIVSSGYTYYAIPFRLHRALVLFPVFFGMMAMLIKKFGLDRKIKYLLLSFIIIYLSGLYFYALYIDTKEPQPNWGLIEWLEGKIGFDDGYENKRMMYFIPKATEGYISINDELQYFLPQLTSSDYNNNDRNFRSCKIAQNLKGIFVISTKDDCYPEIKAKIATEYGYTDYGIFRDKTKTSYWVFEKNR